MRRQFFDVAVYKSVRLVLRRTLWKFHWLPMSLNCQYETAGETALFVSGTGSRFYEFVFTPQGTKRELNDESSSRQCEYMHVN